MDKNLESLKAVIRKGFEKADSRNEYTNEPRPYFESQISAIAECLQEEKYRKADDLLDEIAGLTGKCDALQKDNENLLRTLEEGREVVEEAKLDTAKRIYQKLYDLCTRDDNPFLDYDLCAEDIVEWAKEEGVEIDE